MLNPTENGPVQPGGIMSGSEDTAASLIYQTTAKGRLSELMRLIGANITTSRDSNPQWVCSTYVSPLKRLLGGFLRYVRGTRVD